VARSLFLRAAPVERVDFIEHQLSHVVRDTNGRAHNRTAHSPRAGKWCSAGRATWTSCASVRR